MCVLSDTIINRKTADYAAWDLFIVEDRTVTYSC